MNYSEYLSEEQKRYYTDEWSLNERAFKDFRPEGDYRIIFLTLDLSEDNKRGREYGDERMRSFIREVPCHIFHIQGEKFNLAVEKERTEEVLKFLEEYEGSVYYGLVDEPYSEGAAERIRRKGIDLMYEDRERKRLIADVKGNTPLELRETETRKYLVTMWYSVAEIKTSDTEAKLYIYPTKFCKPMQSIPIIAVIDDYLSYRVFYGADIEFGIEGTLFRVNARFDRDGHLCASVLGKAEVRVENREGEYVPCSFGKRVGDREIYPIKRNIKGLCDYVLLSDGEAILNTEGTIENAGREYGVHMDSTCIELVEE